LSRSGISTTRPDGQEGFGPVPRPFTSEEIRAMERRRYNPTPEGLEGRDLLSLFGSTPKQNATVSVQNLPETFRQKEQRIEHLPFYIGQIQAGRFLPPDTMQHLQADLNDVAARLHAPSTPVVNAFNRGLRHLEPDLSLSPSNARLLNASFGSVLSRAGATPEATANLQRDMNELALVDSKSTEPSYLARNDYALVLQTALEVGRPIQTPTAPGLAPTDGLHKTGTQSALTHNHLPTLNGTYEAGATKIGFMRMQIIDPSEQVLGTGTVEPSGSYSVKLTTPLPDGTYVLRARAIDEVGHVSNPSLGALRLKVVSVPSRAGTGSTAATPAGPLGLG